MDARAPLRPQPPTEVSSQPLLTLTSRIRTSHITSTAKIYERRVYNGFSRENLSEELRYGPNIKDWPKMYPMSENMLLELAAVIHDPVTTTDELIPSGETSSYRSNPLKLSEFALSRRVPEYVGLSKRIQKEDLERREGNTPADIVNVLGKVGANAADTSFGSCVFANRPGDGSAREQAASCQKVLGGDANICYEYAASAIAPTASTGA